LVVDHDGMIHWLILCKLGVAVAKSITQVRAYFDLMYITSYYVPFSFLPWLVYPIRWRFGSL
jgi:hypothetical protein